MRADIFYSIKYLKWIIGDIVAPKNSAHPRLVLRGALKLENSTQN